MRILSVELYTNDLDGTAGFYRSVLEMPVHHCDASVLELGAGTSRLVFRESVTHRPVYHLAFNIPYALVNDAARLMAQRVTLIPHEGSPVVDFDAWNAKAFYFYDNNGNILELIGRADLGRDAEKPFSPACISSVSEVAIVEEDVRSLSAKIRNATGVDQYEKQPFHENFAAMGDASGLLILSAVNRHWFPTDVPAMKFPLRTVIANGDNVYHLEFNF